MAAPNGDGSTLICGFQASGSSGILSLTSSDDGKAFTTPPLSFPKMPTGGAVALAYHEGGIYVAYQAGDSTQALTVASTADGVNFDGPPNIFSGIQMGSAPAMIEFADSLYVAFQANNPSKILYVTSSPDGIDFSSPATAYKNIVMDSAPSMAVFNGLLFIAFLTYDASQDASFLNITSSPDGVTFTPPAKIFTDFKASVVPAMAAFNGKLCFAGNFDTLDDSLSINFISSADGINKDGATGYGFWMRSQPAIAIFDGRLNVAFQDGNDPKNALSVTSSDDGLNYTKPLTRYDDIQMGGSPGLAVLPEL